MSKPLVDIMNLNLTRYGSEFNEDKFFKIFNEELDELKLGLKNNDLHEIIDAANDLIAALDGLITQHKYNPELTLKQTVKEITSRKQDPNQADAWSKNPNLQNIEKWQKDKSQDPSTLYKADYSTCKISTLL